MDNVENPTETSEVWNQPLIKTLWRPAAFGDFRKKNA